MIRVLSIVPYQFLPPTTGGAKSIGLFNHYFSRLARLYCVGVRKNKTPAQPGYEFLPLLSDNMLRYVNPFYFFKLKKIVLREKISHLVVEHPYYGWLGIWLQKRTGVKLIVHSHNIESLRFKSLGKWWWKLLWWYEKAVHRCADLNFFISQEDLDYAMDHFRLKPAGCAVITYGISRNAPPAPEEKKTARAEVCSAHGIDGNNLLLLYNGAFNYRPNIKGLECILKEINPLLLQSGIAYKVLICGSHLPESYRHPEAFKEKNIIYAGFVEDIDRYFLAADIFLNPIGEGGGIKTKLVEALGAGTTAISFQNGAIGIPEGITGKKLAIIENGDVKALVEKVMDYSSLMNESIPEGFYQHFYWGKIVKKAFQQMQAIG